MWASLSEQEELSLYWSTGYYFSHILRSNLLIPEKQPEVHFVYFSELEFQQMRHTFRVQQVFILFRWNLARMLPNNLVENFVGEFLFFASFKSIEYWVIPRFAIQRACLQAILRWFCWLIGWSGLSGFSCLVSCVKMLSCTAPGFSNRLDKDPEKHLSFHNLPFGNKKLAEKVAGPALSGCMLR